MNPLFKKSAIALAVYCVSPFSYAENTTQGTNAGSQLTGDHNVMIGESAGLSATGTDYSVFIGKEAGYSNTLADDNVFIGYQAGYSETTSTDNTFVGTQAGYTNHATDNTFIGTKAGFANTTGGDNTFIGEEAGMNNTEGYDNTFIGEDTGYNNTGGDKNTAIGSRALYFNKSGYYNTAIGFEAGWEIGNAQAWYSGGAGETNAVRNTVVGNSAGLDIGAGIANTCVGDNACPNTEHADFNTFIGVQAGFDNNRTNTDGENIANRNTGLGTYAGYTNRTGADNVWIGAFSDSGKRLANYDHETEVNHLKQETAWTIGEGHQETAGNTDVHRTTVMGNFASSKEDDSISIGYNARTENLNSIAIGSGAISNELESIVLGYQTLSHGNYTFTVGSANTLSWDPNTDAVTSLGTSSYRFKDVHSNKVSINAAASSAATIDLHADAGSADDDKWAISAADGGDLTVSSQASGSSANILTLENDGDVTIAGNLTVNSDRRLKQGINKIANATELLSKIEGVTYLWKPELKRDNKKQYGLIAQNVEAAIPELISEGKDGIKSVNYQAMIPVLINAVNDQQKQIAEQQKQIEALVKLLEAK
ncbi:tail fiber domain-containing protein [Aliikangiella coralliicola]|uniref:Peptidase S74 domain-containing protein n=1 Tax=Aliikangiella coralliicola TaxID=2592383 RepID=A0A545UJ83_9GAMM|nr:tail fiber domain-containing protein [Aliikangiella coralliicola]TQV89518.1 hypothetical protein FLL46_01145 [Aliikangiella coralliicola]